MIRAAIDIGTVTTRLLIGELQQHTPTSIETLDYRLAITNLGEGLGASGSISEAACQRLIQTLTEFAEAIAAVKASQLFQCSGQQELPLTIVATSAIRDAANAEAVRTRLRGLGFEIEVISGSREAELSFLGTVSGFSGLAGNLASIDVGGGSTELILGTQAGQIAYAHSFDIGSRRVTERFLTSDPPRLSQLDELRAWIERQLEPVVAALPARASEVLAVAGSATSAITIRDRIGVYDSALVHGKRLRLAELEALIQKLALLPLAERKRVTGLHPGRAEVIVGGLVILAAMLRALGRQSLIVSDMDILQGILLAAPAIC